jgi:hypothetical protein
MLLRGDAPMEGGIVPLHPFDVKGSTPPITPGAWVLGPKYPLDNASFRVVTIEI